MEPLSDPLRDRVVDSVPKPPHHPLPLELMIKPFSKLPNWKMIKDHLAAGGSISRNSAIYLITQARFIFERERSILELSDPVTVIGDIHGQLYDLLYILDSSDSPVIKKFLFLGDYVDRGRYSIESIFLLFALKVNYPYSFYMLRGNHESRQMTSRYSFRRETLNKYNLDLYDEIMDAFDSMPLACIINNSYFAVHGGISPLLENLEDLVFTDRFGEPKENGIISDLLWSDPCPADKKISNYSFNTTRGCGSYFGKKAVKAFMHKNKFKGIIRAHEVQKDGYSVDSIDKSLSFITIFSAANYCGHYGNKGGFLVIVDGNLKFSVFDVNPQPFELPSGDDLFTWSIPFVIQKVKEFFQCIFKPESEENTFSGEIDIHRLKKVAKGLVGSKDDIEEIHKHINSRANLASLNNPTDTCFTEENSKNKIKDDRLIPSLQITPDHPHTEHYNYEHKHINNAH